ncbi:MAG TPA: M48 family metallopeptidase [Actinomycetota bacterium]|nr:M48 family metallopeptidase [Actinomycetota bacterium]
MSTELDLNSFTPEEVDRARRYHRPLYRTFLIDVLLSFGTLGVLAFSGWGDALYRVIEAPWGARTIAFTALTVTISSFVRMPVSFWRGYIHEKKWGFSTQTVGGWLTDRLKGLAVGVVLSSLMIVGFVALARWFPRSWVVVTAIAGAVFVLLLSFVAPVILEPIFNKFRPLHDERQAEELRALAVRAGVPVRDVLVSDASRRTKKENAYVSGLGKTRRVVLYDTLLARADPRQTSLVVAHELGHRRRRHVAKGTVLGMLSMAAGVLVLWATLSFEPILSAIGATSAGDPRVVPFVLLAGGMLQFLALPFESWLSRSWERDADRFSLELTGDLEVFERSHRELAVSNLSDLDPPRLLYLMAFTHPTPPERIASARRWARTLRRGGVSEPNRPTTA